MLCRNSETRHQPPCKAWEQKQGICVWDSATPRVTFPIAQVGDSDFLPSPASPHPTGPIHNLTLTLTSLKIPPENVLSQFLLSELVISSHSV
jgi:hypothetical protein